MVEYLAEQMVERQVKKHQISEDDVRIYRYGYILILETLMNILVALLIGVLMNGVEEILVFLVLFIPLRSYSGGWHAPTVILCSVFSNIALVICVLATRTNLLNFSGIEMLGMDLLFIGIIGILAPMECKEKRLDAKEKRCYKKIVLIQLGIHLTLLLFMLRNGNMETAQLLLAAHMLQEVLLGVGRVF